MQSSNARLKAGIYITIFAAIVFRIMGLSFISLDTQDFIIPWYNILLEQGFHALAEPFSNYTPPYLYFLWFAALTNGVIPRIIAIKMISTLFDFGNAWMIYKILKIRYPQGLVPVFGASLFLALPTIFLNSGYWGQADSVYTFFILVSLYYLLQNRPLPAMLAFGAGFAFKAQAIFFTPLLLFLTLKRRVPWIYYLFVPLLYLVFMLPAILTGRPLMDVMTIYLHQADTYHQLSMDAPNFYLFISDSVYRPAVLVGLGWTTILVITWVVTSARLVKSVTPDNLILLAAISAISVPFFLPKMHERYFYLADILIFLLAFYVPRLWLVPIGSQIVSTLTYSIFLSIASNSYSVAIFFLAVALLINTWLVGYLLWYQYKSFSSFEGEP